MKVNEKAEAPKAVAKADKAIAVLRDNKKLAKKKVASEAAVKAVKKAKTKTISATKTRAKKKLAHAHRGVHIVLSRDSVAARWVVETLKRCGSLGRSDLLKRMKTSDSKKIRSKVGSFNWCLDQLQNDFLIKKEQKHGGKYSVTDKGKKALEEARAS